MNTRRRFKMKRPLTFPLELYAGPGAVHQSVQAGEVVEIDAERCQQFDRFIRGRIRAEDMVELDPDANMSAAAARKE